MRSALKLQPELVPRPLWNVSANKLLRLAWQREIRPAIFDDFSGICSHCKAETPLMYAHEQWEYDDAHGVALLTGIELACQHCNTCLHIGRCPPEHKAEALRHLAAVNEISVADAKTLEREARAEWARRSGRQWRVVVAPSLVVRFPILAGLPDRAAAATEMPPA